MSDTTSIPELLLAAQELDRVLDEQPVRSGFDPHAMHMPTVVSLAIRRVREAARAALASPVQEAAATALQTVPEKPGVYAWSAGAANALVLVDRRPSGHSPGGILNGHVINSTMFYDGCAVTEWGQAGKWVLLHDFAVASTFTKEPSNG